MAIDLSGQGVLLKEGFVTIKVKKEHPLFQLALVLPWDLLIDLVVKDLKASTRLGFWWMGRNIKVRIHLGAYILQHLYNLTDRKVEYQLKDNAAFQLFCGVKIVEEWHAPDHTKIEEFRNRLSPETQRHLANIITKTSVDIGFGDPQEVDFDSTVQEANIAYPSDASLMTKLAEMGKKVVRFIKQSIPCLIPKGLDVDIKKVKQQARKYFFLAKSKSIEMKREIFKNLHKTVKAQMRQVVSFCQGLTDTQIAKLPWNIRNTCNQIRQDAWRYLLDVGHFTRKHTLKIGKILSFHIKSVSCIKKGKFGKEYEFGRVFQLGRIKGNFLFVLESTTIDMNDKQSFIPLLQEHASIFGSSELKNIATDKGYWSAKNRKELVRFGIETAGFSAPSTVKSEQIDSALQERLHNRRAGIEPLIGHAKHGGQLGKSRMKTDRTTLAAGYSSIFGFNLRQLIRRITGKATALR